MPMRYIKVPESITVFDPRTKRAFQERIVDESGIRDQDAAPLTWEDFLYKLMLNPIWDQGRPNARAAEAIWKAHDESKVTGVMVLAEEDWNKLKGAVENPQRAVSTPYGVQPQAGWGYLPIISPQLRPFVDAVADAPTTPPTETPKT